MHSVCPYMSLAYYRKPGLSTGNVDLRGKIAYATPSHII